MQQSRKRKRQEPSPVLRTEPFDDWFAREMAELKRGIARLEAAPAPTLVEEARGMARAKAPEVLESPEIKTVQPPPVAPAPQPKENWPTGTDLADPANFGVKPPTEALERGEASADEYRQRLSQHLTFATKVLHTSRVPAAVWREWRMFEKTARERLRELAASSGVAFTES